MDKLEKDFGSHYTLQVRLLRANIEVFKILKGFEKVDLKVFSPAVGIMSR